MTDRTEAGECKKKIYHIIGDIERQNVKVNLREWLTISAKRRDSQKKRKENEESKMVKKCEEKRKLEK